MVAEWQEDLMAAMWRGVSLLLLIKLSALYTLPSSVVVPDLPLQGIRRSRSLNIRSKISDYFNSLDKASYFTIRSRTVPCAVVVVPQVQEAFEH